MATSIFLAKLIGPVWLVDRRGAARQRRGLSATMLASSSPARR